MLALALCVILLTSLSCSVQCALRVILCREYFVIYGDILEQNNVMLFCTNTAMESILMSDIQQLIELLRKFRDERDWSQFHNAKDLALALNIEAGELLEAFLWKTPQEANVDSVKEELADVISFALLLADQYGLDVKQIVMEKMEKNARKYPVEKSKGTAKKYTEL